MQLCKYVNFHGMFIKNECTLLCLHFISNYLPIHLLCCMHSTLSIVGTSLKLIIKTLFYLQLIYQTVKALDFGQNVLFCDTAKTRNRHYCDTMATMCLNNNVLIPNTIIFVWTLPS